MAKELLLVRTVCNAAFLAEDGARRAAAESFALGISVVTANPALKEVFTAAVLLAWSYVESVLYLVPEKTKTARFLDVCEADIRCTEGNANFRIDWCLDAFVVRAEYAGSFGDRFAVEKEASYH